MSSNQGQGRSTHEHAEERHEINQLGLRLPSFVTFVLFCKIQCLSWSEETQGGFLQEIAEERQEINQLGLRLPSFVSFVLFCKIPPLLPLRPPV